jgi:beta-glucosidase
VISDYNGIDQLPGDFADHVRTAVNAGIDMFMQPASFAQFEATLLDEVNAGRVSTARIDDAVSRILTKKFQLGLFERPFSPSCNFCTPQQLEPKSLTLDPADTATVDKVCAAIAKCVVLVVSGRPQVFDTSAVDALVASWLPGSEGDGDADVLFGKKPFTGRLSQTWPASADQEPINVGDATYAPAFPYGWGLRTDSPWARLQAARASLGTGDAALRAARADITQALSARFWSGDRIKDKASVVAALARAAGDLTRTTGDPFSAGDAVVSVVRDLQQAVAGAGRAPADAASLSAKADVQSVSGRPDQAVVSLVGAGALR